MELNIVLNRAHRVTLRIINHVLSIIFPVTLIHPHSPSFTLIQPIILRSPQADLSQYLDLRVPRSQFRRLNPNSYPKDPNPNPKACSGRVGLKLSAEI